MRGQTQPTANARRLVVLDRKGHLITTPVDPALYSQPAFSPDGLRLAVVKTDPQTHNQDLWIIDLACHRSMRLTSNPSPETLPAWSPDGRFIAFVSSRPPAGGGVYRVAADGSTGEELLYRHTGFGGINSLEWSTDGQSLYFSDLINISGALYRIAVDGDGQRTEIMRPPFFGSRVSPDGQLIAYQSSRSGRNEIYVQPFPVSGTVPTPASERRVSREGGVGMVSWRNDGHELFYLAPDRWVMAVDVTASPILTVTEPRKLFRAADTIRAPGSGGPGAVAAVSPDGQRFAVAIPSQPALQRLAVLDRNGRTIRSVGPPDLYSQPSLSPDEKRVAFVHTDPSSGAYDIRVLDLARQRTAAITSDTAVDASPIWSPDGLYVAFVSTRGDYTGIYRKARTGRGSAELLYQHTAGTPSVVLTDWSVDGRFMSFHAGDILYVLPLDGDRRPIEVVRNEFSSVGGRFSPDGRYLAYLSDESGRYEVYVRPLTALASDDARPTQVSTQGALGMIFWHRDGRELGYLAADGNVTVVNIVQDGALRLGRPRPLFPARGVQGGPYGVTGNPAQLRNVNGAADHFVFIVPSSPTR